MEDTANTSQLKKIYRIFLIEKNVTRSSLSTQTSIRKDKVCIILNTLMYLGVIEEFWCNVKGIRTYRLKGDKK